LYTKKNQTQGKLSMDYSTLPTPRLNKEEAEPTRNSLYEALQALPDGRRGAGKRYPLAVVLCLLCLAKMAGQTTLKGATEWVRLRSELLAKAFELPRPAMPCQMTYKRVLERLDATRLNELLAAFFTRWEAELRCGTEPSRLQTQAGSLEHAQVAIDGKTIRSTSKEAHPVHQLCAYDVQTGVVLFQVNIQEKQNEISALKPLLTPSFIKGRIFTLDAMHTQTELCRQVDRFGGFYILIAKENQPTLRADLVDFFASPPPGWLCAQGETWDKAHGRLEHRQITCTTELNEWFADRWASVAQVFRLQRTTTLLKTQKVRQETVYGISNLSLLQAPPGRFLALNRGHWGIESRLHYRRDVTLGEDRCQTRTGNAPALLACLNSAILSLMDRLGVSNVPRQIRFFDAHVPLAVQALLSGCGSAY
jgi:predicted transposase YbfD/YdcC